MLSDRSLVWPDRALVWLVRALVWLVRALVWLVRALARPERAIVRHESAFYRSDKPQKRPKIITKGQKECPRDHRTPPSLRPWLSQTCIPTYSPTGASFC